MSEVKWSATSGGDWATASDWTGGLVPTASDDALIDAAGTYTVTLSSADAARSLTVNDAGATVVFDFGGVLTLGGDLAVTAGTVALTGGGEISGGVLSAAGGTFQWSGGTLDGVIYEGTLDLSAQNAENLYITSKGLAVKGAGGVGEGTIKLTGDDSILWLDGVQTLDKATVDIGNGSGNDDTIDENDLTGKGAVLTLGAGLTIDQTGIYARITSSGNAGDAVVNKGVIEVACVAGEFLIDPMRFINQGTITLSTGASITCHTVFDNTAGTLTLDSGSAILVGSGFALESQGALSNAGAIDLLGSGGAMDTDLRVYAKGVTLSGGGVVSLGGSTSRIVGVSTAATLTNVDDTIEGTGFVGLGEMTLVNEAAGVIDASTHGLSLVLGTAAKTLANAGLFEATNGAVLVIASTAVDDSGGGTILASGARVDLQVSDIVGGTLKSSGGAIDVNAPGATLDGTGSHAVTLAGGEIDLIDKTSLTLLGSIVNKGSFLIAGGADATDLIVGAGGATLSGGGSISMTARSVNTITASVATTLANIDNRITGSGTIGSVDMALINEAKGFIGSNSAVALIIDTGGTMVTNAGTIEGGNGTGGLTIESAVDNTGKLIAFAGNLTVEGAVTGAGTASLASGTLTFDKTFDQNVTFGAGTSTLVLAQSQGYGATITGFTKTGSTRLDLEDIAFKSAGEATFAGGVLTVTDGTHTARIHLAGSFTAGSFVASSDGHGGVIVVDPATASPARFVAAMAAMHAATPGTPAHVSHSGRETAGLLAPPKA